MIYCFIHASISSSVLDLSECLLVSCHCSLHIEGHSYKDFISELHACLIKKKKSIQVCVIYVDS